MDTIPKRRSGKRSLRQRLAAACFAVPATKMDGRAEAYDYVKASTLYDLFRQELKKENIFIVPREKSISEKDVPTPTGVILRQVTLEVEYEIIDLLAKEDSILINAYGVGMDPEDKAIYKAKTGALKYLFRGLGIIPWIDADDVEFDNGQSAFTNTKVYEERFDKRTKKMKKVNDTKIRAFDAMCHKGGKTARQVAEYLKTVHNAETIAELRDDEFTVALHWAAGSPEALEATLTQTVEIINRQKKKATVLEMSETVAEAQGD